MKPVGFNGQKSRSTLSTIITIALLLVLPACLFSIKTFSQNGYIYVHKKTINETSSLDFAFALTNTGGTTIKTFTLSDKPDNFLNVYDLGAGHGNGAGDLWTIAGTANTGVNNTGTIYGRQAGASTWVAASGVNISNGSPSAIDGAYQNQFVYISGGRVYFYSNGSSTQIYTGTDAKDVAAANGKIVLTTNSGSVVKTWNGAYGTAGITTASTAWTNRTITGNAERLDMDVTGTNIVYINTTSGASVYTIGFASGTASSLNLSNGTSRPGSTNTPGTRDVAWDDNGRIYATGASSIYGNTDIIYSYLSGTWTSEPEARGILRMTGGPGGQAWGAVYEGTGFAQAIWSRTDEGNHLWIDDERVKSSSSLPGNTTMIEVPAGKYTLTENFSNTSWDLGRFSIYDPTNNTTGNNASRTATINVAAGEVVHVEYINELLIPKAIQLNCSEQFLQSFDAGTGSGQFGTGAYGSYVEGTSYHYYAATGPQDGYYTMLKSLTATNWFVTNVPALNDHTGNGGYFMLVNASYGRDEFYRQRITNLVPGVKYSISFWAADALGTNPIRPNIYYGMQDLNGNIYGASSTGDIYTSTAGTNTAVWRNYSIIFTQPSGVTTADLFLKNNNIGGLGNDLAIDDITLNPVLEQGSTNIVPPILCTAPYPYNYTLSNPQPGGVWSSSNPTVASIDAKTGVLTSGLVSGTAVITYYLTNPLGCITSATSNVTIHASPVVTAAANTTAACVGQTVSLSSSAMGIAPPFSYSWSATPAATSGLGAVSSQNPTASPTASGSYSYIVTTTDALGCKGSDTADVMINTGSVPTVTATATAVPNSSGNICAGVNSVNLSATPSPAGSYTYTWTGSGVVSPNSQTTAALPTASGNFTVNIVNSQGCYANATTASTVVWPVPTVDPQSIYQVACRNQTINLYSNASGGTAGYSYAWSRSPAAGNTLSSATAANPTVTYTTSGNYVYDLTVTDAKGCTASGSASVQITNNTTTPPTLTFTTLSPNPVCAGGTVNLGVTRSATTSGTYTYTWSGDGIASTTTTSTGGTLTTSNTAAPSASGAYTVVVTNSAGCSRSITSSNLTVRPLPEVVLSSNTSNTCVDKTINLTADITQPTQANYTYTWAGSGLSSTSTGPTSSISASKSATVSSAGTYSYTVQVSDNYGCKSVIDANATVPVVFGAYPAINSIALSATTTCSNNTITLTPSVSSGTAPYSYFWSGSTGAGLVDANTAVATANPTIDANYALLLIDKNGCSATRQTPTITVYQAPEITAQVDNANFCSGTAISLSSTPSSGSGTYSSFLWTYSTSAAGGLATPAAKNTTATPTTSGTYTVKVTDSRGCAGTADVPVTVKPIPDAVANRTSQTKCSNSNLSSIVLTGSVAGTNFNWTRNNGAMTTGPVTGVESAGAGDITGRPVNTTTAAVTVTFTITPEADGCTGNPITSKLVVNPRVSATLSGNQTTCGGIYPVQLTVQSAGPYPFDITLSDGSLHSISQATTSISVSPATTTTYSITSMSVATCAASGGLSGTALISIPTATAPVGTWVCGSDNDWFNPCNWGGKVVPDNTIDVTIPATASCTPVVNPNSAFAPADKIARAKNISIATNLSLAGSADMFIAGNWINLAGVTGFTPGTSTVTLMGNAAQSISTTAGSTETFYNLRVNNSSGLSNAVSLNSPVDVTGNLVLVNGIVKTAAADLLTVTNPAITAVSGGSTGSYVWGPLRRNTNTIADYAYPVGAPGSPYTDYRPAILVPEFAGLNSYDAQYWGSQSSFPGDNHAGTVNAILETEHWNIQRSFGATDVVLKLDYINPNTKNAWTNSSGPCSNCNVAIVTPMGPSNYWYFTNGFNFNTGFDGTLPESRFYANSGQVYSKRLSSFGDFTFGYSYAVILPVKLVDFSGIAANGKDLVSWQIANPGDALGYDLQYSTDGKEFVTIGKLLSSASNTYQFSNPSTVVVRYYRLLVKEMSGGIYYGKTIMVTNASSQKSTIESLKPNIATNETFLFVHSWAQQTMLASLVDMSGRKIAVYKEELQAGENKIRINTQFLSSGAYNFQVILSDGNVGNLRFVKN